MKFLRAAEFSAHLLPLSKRRGLLLNLLFTQDAECSKLTMAESIERASAL